MMQAGLCGKAPVKPKLRAKRQSRELVEKGLKEPTSAQQKNRQRLSHRMSLLEHRVKLLEKELLALQGSNQSEQAEQTEPIVVESHVSEPGIEQVPSTKQGVRRKQSDEPQHVKYATEAFVAFW